MATLHWNKKFQAEEERGTVKTIEVEYVNSTVVWLNLPPKNMITGSFHLSRDILRKPQYGEMKYNLSCILAI